MQKHVLKCRKIDDQYVLELHAGIYLINSKIVRITTFNKKIVLSNFPKSITSVKTISYISGYLHKGKEISIESYDELHLINEKKINATDDLLEKEFYRKLFLRDFKEIKTEKYINNVVFDIELYDETIHNNTKYESYIKPLYLVDDNALYSKIFKVDISREDLFKLALEKSNSKFELVSETIYKTLSSKDKINKCCVRNNYSKFSYTIGSVTFYGKKFLNITASFENCEKSIDELINDIVYNIKEIEQKNNASEISKKTWKYLIESFDSIYSDLFSIVVCQKSMRAKEILNNKARKFKENLIFNYDEKR